MKLETQCPNCSSKFKVAEENVGRKGCCPSCQAVFEVTASRMTPPPRQKKSAIEETDAEGASGQIQSSPTSNGGRRKLAVIGSLAVLVGIGLTIAASTFFKQSTSQSTQTSSPSQAKELPESDSQTLAVTPTDPSEAHSLNIEPFRGLLSTTLENQTAPTEFADETQKPTEVVLPLKRKFYHRHEIRSSQFDDRKIGSKDDEFTYSLLARTDKKMSLIGVHLHVQDPSHDGKNLILYDLVRMSLYSYAAEWPTIMQEQARFVLDNNEADASVYEPLKKKGQPEDGPAVILLPLSFFQKMLLAQTIAIHVGPKKFELFEDMLEGMRDLASRAPDGKTVLGRHLVRHEKDPAADAGSPGQKSKSRRMPEELAAIHEARKRDAQQLTEKIAVAKSEMKQAKIADDSNSFKKAESSVAELQSELRKLMTAPLDVHALSHRSFKVGQVGRLPNARMIVAQVTDRKNGEAMVDYLSLNTKNVFKLCGIDLTNLDEKSEFNLENENCFHVADTETYETVTGQMNTIFVLERCSRTPVFDEAEQKRYDEAADPNFKIELTAAEEQKLKETRTAKIQANLDKEKLAKSRRSKSNLDSAKLLLKKEERAAARKFLEKSVAEDPDSESGKEAAKLLEELP